ncbi:MAG: hypothetical protein WCS31_12590 [Verrucomicrobiae bacterium]
MTDPGGNLAASCSRRSFLFGMGALALGSGIVRSLAAGPVRQPRSVLIVGDSMALCGFGERLDARFRAAGVREVNTYMACGTQPLSWTTLKGHATTKTRCGFWKIENGKDGGPPDSFQDTYGMTRGHRPAAYLVPKIEDLLPAMQPDVLVVQLGNNLFELLKGKSASRQNGDLQAYITPFLARTMPVVKKIYWVAPPTSGQVSKEAQDTLLGQLLTHESPGMRVIDSRTLITYPYRNLQADKQHFFGADMKEWADKVFSFIEDDLERFPPEAAGGTGVSAAPLAPAVGQEDPSAVLCVEGSLESMTAPFTNREIAPYNESLVAFVYRVRHVLKGTLKAAHIVVLHAAHIGGKRQATDGFFLNQSRTLRLIPLESTPWATLKAKDDPRFVDLERFIREEDHFRLLKQSS